MSRVAMQVFVTVTNVLICGCISGRSSLQWQWYGGCMVFLLVAVVVAVVVVAVVVLVILVASSVYTSW